MAEGQVLRPHLGARLDEHDGMFDDVLQLAHVPVPRICSQRAHGTVAKLGYRALVVAMLLPVIAQEVIGEQRNVFRTLLEARYVDRDDAQPIVQIFTQCARFDGVLWIAIRRRDEAHVDNRIRRLAADAPHDAVLNYAQQLRLRRFGHLEQLVQEERAAVGRLEQAGFIADRAGERAFAVAEHLRFQQRFGKGGAIHSDEGFAAAAAVRVNELRYQLLARAARPRNEHRGVGGRDTPGELDRPAEDGRDAELLNAIAVAVLHRELGLLLLRLARDAHGVHRATDENLEMRRRERLGQI